MSKESSKDKKNKSKKNKESKKSKENDKVKKVKKSTESKKSEEKKESKKIEEKKYSSKDDSLKAAIDLIVNDGINSGQAKADQIIEKAEEKARELVKKAELEAKSIIENAEIEAKKTKEQLNTELERTANTSLSAFRNSIEKALLVPSIDETLGKNLSQPQFMEKIIGEAIKGFIASGFKGVDLDLVLPADLKEKLGSGFASKMKMIAGSTITVEFDDNISFGFKIGPSKDGYKYDLSDEGFKEIFTKFISPKFRSLFYK